MDDLLKRIGALESGVSDIRAQVSAVTAVLPHLATKADLTREVGALREEMGTLRGEMRAEIGTLRGEMHGEMGTLRGEIGTLRGEMHAIESALIKWIVGATIASVAAASGIATAIARFVH